MPGKEYTVLKASSTLELQELVIQYMRSGWDIAGGVACYTTGLLVHYLQAMRR